MIEAYCQLPPKTPTAELIDAKMLVGWPSLEVFQASEEWNSRPRTMLCCVGKNEGFEKYLRNNFEHSPGLTSRRYLYNTDSSGSVWRNRYTHRKLGHVLFCNSINCSWGSCSGIDSNGNSFKYPGWA